MHHACVKGHLEVIKFLIQSGASVHARSDQRETPLHVAAAGNHLEVVWFLVRQHPLLVYPRF